MSAITRSTAIAYLRVSTAEQGRSGVGLAAQRNEIEAFASHEGFAIRTWHQDVQTGAGADALLLRPGLAGALKEARAARCPLIVSRLDRLSRNVHFITGLMEHKVHFMVAALGKDCDHFVLHIYASLAEQERKIISERCKAAAAIQKRNGQKFGLARSKSLQRRASALGRVALIKAAGERAEAYRMHIEWALRQPGINGKPISWSAAANRLNERNIESATGRRWVGEQLLRMALRLGIDHPSRMSRGVARVKVREIWEQIPEVTGKQVVARLGRHHLGVKRAEALLQHLRVAAARRSPMHKRMRWRIDAWTSARIRVGAIWRRHPGFSAEQVLAKLGSQHSVKLWWIRRTLNECWRASGNHSPQQLRVGRRCYGNGGSDGKHWRKRRKPLCRKD